VIQAVLFDLDGTLVDTAPDFVKAANTLRQELNLAPLADNLISAQVSNGSIAVTEIASELAREDAKFKPLQKALLRHYENVLGESASIYPGLQETLQQLGKRSIEWGVVTNKPLQYAKPLLKKLTLDHSAVLICPEHVSKPKPDPEGLLLAAQHCNIAASSCIYVGDHLRDIEAGKAAGMKTIAVGYGYLGGGDNPTQWPADYHCESPQQLGQLIDHLTA